MIILSSLLLTYCLTIQQPTDVEFFNNGKFYSFSLPKTTYKTDTIKYTEGIFIKYTFDNSEMIMLHVGGNQLKPLLRTKEYIVTDKIDTKDILSRKGYNKKTKLFWQEDTIASGDITLYFKSVNKDNLKLYEECLRSLHITRTIR